MRPKSRYMKHMIDASFNSFKFYDCLLRNNCNIAVEFETLSSVATRKKSLEKYSHLSRQRQSAMIARNWLIGNLAVNVSIIWLSNLRNNRFHRLTMVMEGEKPFKVWMPMGDR